MTFQNELRRVPQGWFWGGIGLMVLGIVLIAAAPVFGLIASLTGLAWTTLAWIGMRLRQADR